MTPFLCKPILRLTWEFSSRAEDCASYQGLSIDPLRTPACCNDLVRTRIGFLQPPMPAATIGLPSKLRHATLRRVARRFAATPRAFSKPKQRDLIFYQGQAPSSQLLSTQAGQFLWHNEN